MGVGIIEPKGFHLSISKSKSEDIHFNLERNKRKWLRGKIWNVIPQISKYLRSTSQNHGKINDVICKIQVGLLKWRKT